LPAPWPPATCGRSWPGCHLLTRGVAPGSARSLSGRFPGQGRGVSHVPGHLPVHYPKGRHHLFPLGGGDRLRAPAPSFPLSVPGLSVCDPWGLDTQVDT
jgi:hypothetical protein